MKTDRSLNKVTMIGIMFSLFAIYTASGSQSLILDKEDELSYTFDLKSEVSIVEENNETTLLNNAETVSSIEEEIVFDGLTLTELTDKVNKSLNSTLSGYGSLFVSYTLQYDMDPYLTTAITLLETGCKWKCSTLVTACNNVGGMKGGPSCGGGSYKAFNTLEEGIKSYIDNIYYNYYLKGLVTAEQMNSKYATSTEWATKVNAYINEIKAN